MPTECVFRGARIDRKEAPAGLYCACDGPEKSTVKDARIGVETEAFSGAFA
ncbi:MAG: hypothetical protein KF838_14810 [Phycisphaeraceae bacterium]|nr:MAG: hypothetical protein KF838_14810 [Phycisphaeraceae bacterium]